MNQDVTNQLPAEVKKQQQQKKERETDDRRVSEKENGV